MTFTERFHEASKKWYEGTCYLSSPSQIMAHPSFHECMALAEENKALTIKLMLEELRDHRIHWFWALTKLTGDNPIPQEHAGYVVKMCNDWVEWGVEKSYLKAEKKKCQKS